MKKNGTLKSLIVNIRAIVANPDYQYRLLSFGLYCVFAIVSGFMTIINLITGFHMLMWATLIFSVLCVIDVVLMRHAKHGIKIAEWLFQIEIIALLTFFIITGSPEGFSAIWATMIPVFSMLMYNRRHGTVLSAIMFCVLIFFFWLPIGQSFLMYDYTDSFMLRLPLFYLAGFIASFLFETLREFTFDNYAYLQSHDALTGMLNRRGFDQYIKNFRKAHYTDKSIGFAIIDLDVFKNINDTYGHFIGDQVLKQSAQTIKRLIGLPVCRWGGEEFAIIGTADEINSETMEHLRKGFAEQDIIIDDKVIPFTLSVGSALFANNSLSTDEMCIEADKCLYEAKGTGRNKSVFKKME